MYKEIILFSFMWFSLTNGESTYPSIVWNPWNPLFACDDPKINVQIGDIVNFVCPSDEYTFYVPSSSVTLPYENLYFLGSNKEQYEACNSTGMRKLLNCNGIDPKHKTLTFREFPLSRDSILFEKGKRYYFIGTGFRTKDNLENTINGSCLRTDERGMYKLRLQVYVCADDDAGCHICKTAGCYYKNCGTTKCTNWTTDGIVYRNFSHCFKVETRTCTNTLIGDTSPQTKHAVVHCFSENGNCSRWVSSGNLYYDATALQCFDVKTRTCRSVNSEEHYNYYNENKYTNVTCPDVLQTCSNVTSRYLSTTKCDVSAARYCHIIFGGKVSERSYSPCTMNTIIKPSMIVINTSTAVPSSTLFKASAVPFINSTNVSVNASSIVNRTLNKACSETTTMRSQPLMSADVSKPDTEYQREYNRKRDISEKDSLIHGLAVAVGLAFIIGVMLGALTVRYVETRKCSAKVDSNNDVVVPATTSTLTTSTLAPMPAPAPINVDQPYGSTVATFSKSGDVGGAFVNLGVDGDV